MNIFLLKNFQNVLKKSLKAREQSFVLQQRYAPYLPKENTPIIGTNVRICITHRPFAVRILYPPGKPDRYEISSSWNT